jgi:dephospho-CoA kinase
VQEERVLKRKNMTKDKLRSILASQWPDAKKRCRAAYVVKTDSGIADARRQVKAIWKKLFGVKNARDRS